VDVPSVTGLVTQTRMDGHAFASLISRCAPFRCRKLYAEVISL